MKQYIDEYENLFIEDNSRYNDWEGNPIRKTPDEYRYSYDTYVISKKNR